MHSDRTLQALHILKTRVFGSQAVMEPILYGTYSKRVSTVYWPLGRYITFPQVYDHTVRGLAISGHHR